MFEPIEAVSGGVQLIAVVFGLVEFIKALTGLQGKGATALAAGIGFAVMGLFELQAILPAEYTQFFDMAARSVVMGLSASGYYKFVTARVPKREVEGE